jgi:hypothetical protein
MLHEETMTRSGNMQVELQAKVDKLLEEFLSAVDAITKDRHLPKRHCPKPAAQQHGSNTG